MREAEPRQAHSGHEQQLDRGLDRLLVHRDGGCPRRAARVVDDDVDAAEGFQRPLDEPLEVGGDGDVASDGKGTEPLGFTLEDVAPPGEHRDVRAFLGEGLGDAETRCRRTRRRRWPFGL